MNSARRGWSRPLSLAAVAGLTLAAAGCGGGDASSSDDVASLGTDTASSDATDESTRGSEPPKDPEEAMLAFTECMRDQGVDMPDPAPPGQGGGRAVEIKVDPASDKFEKANAECEPLLEAAMGDMELDPDEEAEMREQMLEFAECMRDHGIDMPDPVFCEGRIEVSPGNDSGDVDQDKWRAAEKECRGPDITVGRAGADDGPGSGD